MTFMDENFTRGEGEHMSRSRVLCTSRVGECPCTSVSFNIVTSNRVVHHVMIAADRSDC